MMGVENDDKRSRKIRVRGNEKDIFIVIELSC
jgi:hypothetical protein